MIILKFRISLLCFCNLKHCVRKLWNRKHDTSDGMLFFIRYPKNLTNKSDNDFVSMTTIYNILLLILLSKIQEFIQAPCWFYSSVSVNVYWTKVKTLHFYICCHGFLDIGDDLNVLKIYRKDVSETLQLLKHHVRCFINVVYWF